MITKCLLLFLSLDFVMMFKTFYSYHSISYKLVTNKFKRQLHSNIIDQSIEEDVHKHFMQLALRHAQLSFRDKEVPVGAVIIDENNQVLATSRNRVESLQDSTKHAEIDCIRKASFIKQNWRLNNCTIYSTLEPCAMCMAAIHASRIKKVVFGAYNSQSTNRTVGETSINIINDSNGLMIIGGVLENESVTLLKNFFRQRREENS